MESLALVVAIIMLSLWFVAAASLIFSFLKLKFLGALCGFVSVAAGAWLLFVLPHVPLLGLINIAAGAVAIKRYFN